MNYDNLYCWLPQKDVPFYTLTDKNETLVIMKIPYDEDFEYIYCQRNYGGEKLSINAAFIYSGIYNRLDNKLYDMRYPLLGVLPKIDSNMNASRIAEKLQTEVRQYVEDYVDIEADRFLNSGFKDPVSSARFEEYLAVSAEKAARRLFLSGETSDDIDYSCGFELGKNENKLLLDYLRTPHAVVEGLGNEYLNSSADDIVFDLLANESLKAYLQDYEEAEDSPLLRQKAIIEAVNNSGAQNVTVTVQRDGVGLSFKYPARYLRTMGLQRYSTWDMLSKERSDFYKAYNNSSNFYPEEITDISYRGKSIYSAEPYVPDTFEDEAFNITM